MSSEGVIEDLEDKLNKKEKPHRHELDMDQFDASLLDSLLTLIRERQVTGAENEEEYIEKKLKTVHNQTRTFEDAHPDWWKDLLFKLYMDFKKYETVINEITTDYIALRKLVNNSDVVRVFVLILLLHLNEFNIENVKNNLVKFNSSLAKSVIRFMSSYDFSRTLCHHFDQTYVKEIIKPKETQDILRQMHRDILKINVEHRKVKVHKTISKPFKAHYERPLKQKMNCEMEEEQTFIFKAKPVPYDILYSNTDASKKQHGEKLKRAERKPKQLCEEANKKVFRGARKINQKKDPRRIDFRESEQVHKFQVRKVQKFPAVEIKTNTTQTLREAARIKQEEGRFEKLLEGLTNGSLGNHEYENYIEEMRKQKEIEELEDIERKKLQALITHEEAFLAKKKVIQKNKREKEEYCQQWEEYEIKMNEIKKKKMEELKLQSYVETKQREKNIRERMKQLVDGKNKLVKEEQEKIRADKERRLDEIAEDMEKKKELIRTINLLRELTQLNNACRVVFDENERNNEGFMYEMSLADLKVRLISMEDEMREDLERRRQKIIDERRAKQTLLQETSKLVLETRNAKKEMRRFEKDMKTCQKPSVSLNMNANFELKLKLEKIRQEREKMEKLELK